MKVHYFQRYHAKENVATANTMLLLSRLYAYSPDLFYAFLKELELPGDYQPEFSLQEKSLESIPDASITQEGFKIVVETKRKDSFYSDQIMRHLSAFGTHKNKVMLTLASEPMATEKLNELNKKMEAYNATQKYPVLHINTTFEAIANAIRDVLSDRDYEIQTVLDDYLDYCYTDGLIPDSDGWKYMRMQLAGTTLDFNIANNLYYDKEERGFRAHSYLGLYKHKRVQAIGKICARITAVETEDGIEYNSEFGELTEDRKQLIRYAMVDGKRYGYNIQTVKHRYFFVEKFYPTDFRKITPNGCRGTRIFDLSQLLETENLPDTAEIARLLSGKSWG